MRGVTRPLQESARIGLAVAWLLIGGPGPAAAHPHVFVDYSVTLVLAGDSLDGIRLTWTFDDLFSGFILQEFDRDRNQLLSPDETRQIEQKHLPEFHRVSYFTTVSVNGKPTAIQAARGFRASAAKGIVTYEFVLPIKASLAATTALEVVIDDPVYYIAYTPVAVTPQSQAVGALLLECRVAQDRTGATPDAVRCGIRRR
jgi:ABC-type uncharacterized transport system substrate-binding protein